MFGEPMMMTTDWANRYLRAKTSACIQYETSHSESTGEPLPYMTMIYVHRVGVNNANAAEFRKIWLGDFDVALDLDAELRDDQIVFELSLTPTPRKPSS